MVSDVLNTSEQHLLFLNSTLTGLKGNLGSGSLTSAMPFPVIVWHGTNDVLLGFSTKNLNVLSGRIDGVASFSIKIYTGVSSIKHA